MRHEIRIPINQSGFQWNVRPGLVHVAHLNQPLESDIFGEHTHIFPLHVWNIYLHLP